MSTYHYLECANHNPPLLSDDEVEQHRDTETLKKVRELVRDRANIVPLLREEKINYPDDYFLKNALKFLVSHEHCKVNLVTEYNEREELE